MVLSSGTDLRRPVSRAAAGRIGVVKVLAAVLTLIAVLAMHGVTNAHSIGLSGAVDHMGGSAPIVHPGNAGHGSGIGHHDTDVVEASMVGCAVAVLVASTSWRRDVVPGAMGRPAQVRALGQHCAAPEPPVPRFALF